MLCDRRRESFLREAHNPWPAGKAAGFIIEERELKRTGCYGADRLFSLTQPSAPDSKSIFHHQSRP